MVLPLFSVFGSLVPSDYERLDFVAMASKSKYVREFNTKTMKLNISLFNV